MPNHIFQTIVVTGINSLGDKEEVPLAWEKAKTLFEPDLISNLSEVGHNFVQSFCIFPCGSGDGREPQLKHQKAVQEFCAWIELQNNTIDYVAVRWDDNDNCDITNTNTRI